MIVNMTIFQEKWEEVFLLLVTLPSPPCRFNQPNAGSRYKDEPKALKSIQVSSLVDRSIVNSTSKIYRQKIQETGEIVAYKEFLSVQESQKFVNMIKQYSQNYINCRNTILWPHPNVCEGYNW